jgi:hypothetical protein
VWQDGDALTLYKPRDAKKPSLEYVFTQLPQGLTPEAAAVGAFVFLMF